MLIASRTLFGHRAIFAIDAIRQLSERAKLLMRKLGEGGGNPLAGGFENYEFQVAWNSNFSRGDGELIFTEGELLGDGWRGRPRGILLLGG